MQQLREYQIRGIDTLSQKYSIGIRKIIFQLATGGGKTYTFAGLSHRYLQSVKRKIVIIVHREELLQQARKTLFEGYGLIAELVTAGVKYINPNADVYVTMVETANNRLAKRPNFFGDVGLVIIDEAHLGNFKKMHAYFEDPKTLIVGFTATPISATKKVPLNSIYDDIVCSIDIPDLITQNALMPNRTYYVKSVDRGTLALKNGVFDEAKMGAEYSKTKHIHNCVDGYERHAAGTKALVFNCTKEHSKLVRDAFIERGYDAKHLYDKVSKEDRKAILLWFKNTPGAILCNIGILTTGFDEPTVQTVIVNKSTKSIPLWLQMTGRGSRPDIPTGKEFFTIIDMGGNALEHGDWCSPRDWDYMFKNPTKPGKGSGVAPIKTCADCEAIISANATVCSFCGTVQPVPEIKYDKDVVEFELLENSISIPMILQQAVTNGYSGYAALHQVKFLIVSKAREQSPEMTPDRAYSLLEVFQHKVSEWCKQQSKNYDQWHKDTTALWFFAEIKRLFNWEPEILSIAL